MAEHRSTVRICCVAFLIWVAAAGSAGADPPTRESWPEIDTWLRLSSAWRLAVFVPLAENLDTHYREGNLILQADYGWAESKRTRRLVDEDRAQKMQIWLLRGGYLGGKSLDDHGAEYTGTRLSPNFTCGFRSRTASSCRTGCAATFAGSARAMPSSRPGGATGCWPKRTSPQDAVRSSHMSASNRTSTPTTTR